MSDLPPHPAQTPIDYSPPHLHHPAWRRAGPTPPYSRRSLVLSWTIILLCVGFVVVGVNLAPQIRGKSGKPRRDDAASVVSSAQLRSSARVAVAQNALLPQQKQQQQQSIVASSLAQLDELAQTPDDRLRVAIVAGELVGKEAALERINRLGEYDVPNNGERSLHELLTTLYESGSSKVDDVDRKRVIERYGWFGQLALAHGLPAGDPNRAAVLAEAKRTMMALMAVGLVLLGALLAGLALLVVAIVLLASGIVRRRFVPVAPPIDPAGRARPVFLEAFALYVLMFVAFGVLAALLIKSRSMSWSMLATAILPVAMWWPVRRGATWAQSMAGFGWTVRGQNLLVEAAMGIVGYIAGLPLLAAALFLSVKLGKLAGVRPSHPIIEEITSGGWRLGVVYLLACVWAPVMEETTFRGALFNHLRGRWGWTVSATITGLIFAAVHPQGWTLIPVLGMIGVVLAAIREWRGTIWASMVAHGFSNFVVTTIAVLTMT